MECRRIYVQMCCFFAILLFPLFVVFVLLHTTYETGITLTDDNKCSNVSSSVKRAESLVMGRCENEDADLCKIKASTDGFRIKATFPKAVITDKATAKLSWGGIEVVKFDACQAGLTCPDKKGKHRQSLDLNLRAKLKVAKDTMQLQVDNASNEPIYCVKFTAEFVA